MNFPIDGTDVLQKVSFRRAATSGPQCFSWIEMATEYRGMEFHRSLQLRDEGLAIKLCSFLENQCGKTISTISNEEIDFAETVG